ncbi:hypothetical protein [Solidesulfovibrio sp. C21]|uniref:hypothetical protein n=1 Tax=Solidesulfovibrio sp. C21 TaxID=3398613 RepID=UPI0039FC8F84
MHTHNADSKQAIGKQYARAYKAIAALGGDDSKTEEVVRFLQSVEMHHVDTIDALCRVQSALIGNKSESDRWHREMNEFKL